MMQDNLQNAMVTVEAMKSTTKELKKQYGREGELVAKVEKAQDELADMMDVGEEVMMGLGRSGVFDVPEGVSEEDLDAELEALGEEMVFDGGGALGVGGTAGELPGFMVDETAGGAGAGKNAMPAFVDEAPVDGKAREVPAG